MVLVSCSFYSDEKNIKKIWVITHLMSWNFVTALLNQGFRDLHTFSRGPGSKYLSVAGHMVSAMTSQLCCWSGKAATDNM